MFVVHGVVCLLALLLIIYVQFIAVFSVLPTRELSDVIDADQDPNQSSEVLVVDNKIQVE